MRLDDFVEHQFSKLAKLSRVHVLALRLYTSSSYPRFNDGLRMGKKPHLFAMSVYYLNDGEQIRSGFLCALHCWCHLMLLIQRDP